MIERKESEWKKLSELLLRAAEEACGVEEGRIQNPWKVGHEGDQKSISRIENAVDRRNLA